MSSNIDTVLFSSIVIQLKECPCSYSLLIEKSRSQSDSTMTKSVHFVNYFLDGIGRLRRGREAGRPTPPAQIPA